MTAVTSLDPQNLSDLLTARGLELIVKQIPGSEPASKKHDLNIEIMNRDWLVRYANPSTTLEIALFKHLKDMHETYGEERTRVEIEQDLADAHESLEKQAEELGKTTEALDDANATIAELRDQLADLETQLVGELV